MKIHGKTFKEIFSELPWSYKIIVSVAPPFILLTFFYLSYVLINFGHKEFLVEPIRFTSDFGKVGMIDPSLSFDGKGFVALVFTVLPKVSSPEAPVQTSVKLTRATPPCRQWNIVTDVFSSKSRGEEETEFLPSGTWRVETPSIVYDPDDPGREWKIYAYKYYWADGIPDSVDVARRTSVIVAKYSSDLSKGWSVEEWLFSPSPNVPPAPYGQFVQQHINALDESLQDVTAYARPSVLYEGGVLLMSLSAFTDGDKPDRVVLLVSLDHGRNWQYVGTPLRREDMAKIGPYTTLAGASLLKEKGQIYLAAVPGDAAKGGLGTLIFPFDNVSKAMLKRDDKKDAPVVLTRVPLSSEKPSAVGGGFAAYADACGENGILASELSGITGSFQIFKTYQKPSSGAE